MTALHQAHALLARANHDYAGHRAKAEANIGHAIRELGGQHNGQHHATGTGGNAGTKAVGGGQAAGAGNKVAGGQVAGNNAGKGNGMHEAQAQSDAQLQQALKLLSGVQGQLQNGHKAAAHVHAAILDLNAALKVR